MVTDKPGAWMGRVEENTKSENLAVLSLSAQTVAVKPEEEASVLVYKPHLSSVLDESVLVPDSRESSQTGKETDGVFHKGPGVVFSVIQGDDNDNELQGTDEDDTIYGYGGNDRIWGNGGNDIIYGGDGNDTIYYTQKTVFETNHIYGGAGIDTVDYAGPKKGF